MAVMAEMIRQSTPAEAEPRELAAMVAALRRHLWLSCAIVPGCLALAVLLTLAMPKNYSAEATLSYDPQMPLIKGGGGLAMTDAQRDAAIDAQLAAVTTLAVAEHVARSVDLAANPELRKAADKLTSDSERPLSRDEALGTALLNHVKARRLGQTPTFAIAFSASSAVQAALIANGFAAGYLSVADQQKAALADGSTGQLGARIAALRQQAIAADDRLAAFRLANNLLEAPDSAALEREAAGLRSQLAEAHGQAASAGMRSTMADAGGAVGDGPTVVGGGAAGTVDTVAIAALTEQRAATAGDLAALLGRYGDRHPNVIAARKKLAELDLQLAVVMRGNRNSAAVEARAAAARTQALATSLQGTETRLAGNISHDPQLLDLQNSALAVRLAYQDALKLGADQTAQRALIQPDAQVIALATPPLRARFPRLGVDLLVGLALGLGAALTAAFVREKWLHTLGTVDDIARWLEADYFAPLHKLPKSRRHPGNRDPVVAILGHPQSAFTASYRSLGTAALFAARSSESPGGRVIGITSAFAGEGKTTASIAVGRVLALAGMKVALVDGNACRRSGQVALTAGASSHDRARPEGGSLVLVAGGTGPNAVPISHVTGELAQMIAGLRRDYDVIVIDTAPILPGGESLHLLASMDALVLLARRHVTPVRAIRQAMRRIAAAGGKVSGVALSMAVP